MLDESDGAAVAGLLEELPCGVRLPEHWRGFELEEGIEPTLYSDRRRFARFRARGKAMLLYRGRRAVVYTKDASREGISFLHDEQLFPKERVRLVMPNQTHLRLVVSRCLYHGERCYEHGSRYCQPEGDIGIPALERHLAELAALRDAGRAT